MKLTVFFLTSGLLLAVPLVALAQSDAFDPFSPNRGSGGADSRERTGSIESVEFVNSEITAIFKMISDLTGWSIIMSPELSQQPPKVNIWIKRMTPEQVLEEVEILAGVVIERQGNTVRVTSFDEYARMRGVAKRVVALDHGDARQVASSLEPFVDQENGAVVADAASNQLVLLLPNAMMDSMVQLVEQLDVPAARDQILVLKLAHLEAVQVVPVLEQFLTQGNEGADSSFSVRREDEAAGEAEGVEANGPAAGQRWLVRFMIVPKLNAVVLRGLEEDLQRTAALIRELDVPTQLATIGYQLRYTNADEVFETLQELLDETTPERSETTGPRTRIAASKQNNRIIVTSTMEGQADIAAIIEQIDRPLPAGSGGVRVYRLRNVSAAEVAEVIRGLIDQRTTTGELARQAELSSEPRYIRRQGAPPRPQSGSEIAGETAVPGETGSPPVAGDLLSAVVTVASQINAVVIRASATEQEAFATVIEQLDEPREQVLLEVTLVQVRADDNFRLGVELSGARVGDVRTNAIGFSHFGIGDVDPATGTITLPAASPFGLNVAVFNAADFSLILNALRSIGQTRITSQPRILALDNSEAVISQINQEPFEVVSQGESTTVTSFGGFVDAGTELTVLPHIADGWLRLEYEVALSSFGSRTSQQVAANLPPPRRESLSRGIVRVPGEHIVVLGGLASTRDDEVVDQVPLLGNLPLIGELFKNRTQSSSNETLYIFIRPVVLRDPAFGDLIALSAHDLEQAQQQPQTPRNEMRLYMPPTLEESSK